MALKLESLSQHGSVLREARNRRMLAAISAHGLIRLPIHLADVSVAFEPLFILFETS